MTLERFLHDRPLQDSIVAAIVSDHTLMSALIDKIAEDRQRHELVIQHRTRLLNEKPGGSEHDHASHKAKSDYVGDETREIKSLSDADVRALLGGEGMGMAMPAELNHYPGPRHVLDLASRLHLSKEQARRVQRAFEGMHAKAIQLGKQLVEEERVLDRAFATKTVSLESLNQMTGAIEALRARLRTVHLGAHITVRNVLTLEQIETYDRLRGYATIK